MKHTRARPWPPVIKLNLTEAMVRARPSLFFAYDARAFPPSMGQDSLLNVTFSSEAIEGAMRTVGSIQSFFEAQSVVAKVAPFVQEPCDRTKIDIRWLHIPDWG